MGVFTLKIFYTHYVHVYECMCVCVCVCVCVCLCVYVCARMFTGCKD